MDKWNKVGYACGYIFAMAIVACLCVLLGAITGKLIYWLWLL